MQRRPYFPLSWLIVCAFIAVTARADLVLTNYTAARPLKVLISGDSITDDSVTNGAWRAYLGKLLATNNYVFTNLGRWLSSTSTGFTQVRHEGMDGSVIAGPGLSGPTHGYAKTNNYALLTLADALTNATPDLVLIDLGVNDMGQGRNPFLVATNHLPALLDLIFSKLPGAHIIVSKPTTITYANILTFKNYGTNMFAFCDGVQALAAARRAQGQKVFVADLFSAVTGTTMMNSDGTHPNATGLSAIANEMMFRISTITTRPDSATTPFILAGSVWKYSDQGLDLGTNWYQRGFDDLTWTQGAGRLGYGIFGTTTGVGFGPDSTNKYITTYFRQAFVVPQNIIYTNLGLRLNRADGAVVWLNGQELYRVNLPAGSISAQTLATSSVNPTNDAANTYFPTNFSIVSLPAGTNIIAVEIHKNSPGGASLTFDLELFGKGYYAPSLSFSSTADALQVAWPSNYTSFSLQSAPNLSSTNAWQIVPGPYSVSNNFFRVSIQIDADSPQFFRLTAPGQ